MKKLVKFKINKDKLIIDFDINESFETLKNLFVLTLEEQKTFIGGAKVRVLFTGKKLAPEEEAFMIKKLEEYNVTVIECKDELKLSDKKSIIKEEKITKNTASEVSRKESKKAMNKGCMFHYGNLRSGESIRSEGDLIIHGDVKIGAKVEGKGNIVIVGKLYGNVTTHLEEGTITALVMDPIQLKIGKKIAINPRETVEMKDILKNTLCPEIAYVKEGKIFVEEVGEYIRNK